MSEEISATGSRSTSLLAVAVPVFLGLAVFFSWIVLVNTLKVPFYLYHYRTIFLVYVSRSLDPMIWLASSAATLILLAATTRQRSASIWGSVGFLWVGIVTGALVVLGLGPQVGIIAALATLIGCAVGGTATIKHITAKDREHFILTFVLTISILLLLVELASLSYYVLSAFHPGTDVGRSWEMLEMQFWYTAFPLVPFMYAGFLFSWIWAPLIAKIRWKSRSISGPNEAAKTKGLAKNRSWLAVLGCFVVLAAFLGYYPYFHDPTYPLVGVDIYWRNALPAERVLSSTSWLVAAAKERHPLVVLGIAVASKLTGMGAEAFLRFAYIGLILAFGLTVFVLVLLASRSKALASLSALISAAAVTTTGGMYTGTIAEWTALIVWIMSLISLAIAGQSLRRQLISTLCLAIGSLAVLFIHPWTWIAMIVTLIAYCLIMFIARPKGYRREIGPVLAVVFLNVAGLALSLLVLMKTQGWRVAEAFSLVQESLGSKYFGLGSWEILVFFSQIWSQFLNPVLLGLAILGVIVLARRRGKISWIVLAWIVAACATNVLAAPMGYDPLNVNRGETQIFRAMFLTPFQIPAALGLLHLKLSLHGRIGRSRHAGVAANLVVGLLFLAIVNGAFRALFPLLTDPHNYPNPLAP